MNMYIFVKAQTKTKKNYIKKLTENSYRVGVTIAPENGKANKKIIELLSKYFKTKKANIILVAGHKSNEKIFNLNL